MKDADMSFLHRVILFEELKVLFDVFASVKDGVIIR